VNTSIYDASIEAVLLMIEEEIKRWHGQRGSLNGERELGNIVSIIYDTAAGHEAMLEFYRRKQENHNKEYSL
jgi:hypothetical protein